MSVLPLSGPTRSGRSPNHSNPDIATLDAPTDTPHPIPHLTPLDPPTLRLLRLRPRIPGPTTVSADPPSPDPRFLRLRPRIPGAATVSADPPAATPWFLRL